MFYPAFYFLSSLKPPRINAEDHSSCSSERCLVTSKLSKPLHRTDECLCEDVVVPVNRVNTIIASRGIPLVRITRSPLGKTELEVVPYTPSSRFIAVSHVWADQQFGSAQNRLPRCQVEYLEEVLSSLPTSMDHWGIARMGCILAVFSVRRDRTAESCIRILLVGQLLHTSICRTRRPSKQSNRVNEPHLRCGIPHLSI